MNEAVMLIGESLYAAAGMFWDIFWALVLGFFLSGVVIAFAPKKGLVRLLGKAGPKELALATFLGSVSSSCSYAAASMSRSLFRKGAHIIPSLAFMLASTNLVIELSLILWVMLGWQFVVAEFLGGLVLIALMAILFQLFGPLKAFEEVRGNLSTEAHTSDEIADPKSLAGWREVARAFLMEWQMLWKDIALGVLVSGFMMVLVPNHFWQSLFLQSAPTSTVGFNFFQLLENSLIGPIVSVLSFVCSVGNIPLAGVLYHGGISFGGALSFIYADLIIIPLILVYRRDYGWKLALWIVGIFYISMVITGILIDLLFRLLNWVPVPQKSSTVHAMHFFELNYTFWLNLVFLGLTLALIWLAQSGPKEAKPAGSCCDEP